MKLKNKIEIAESNWKQLTNFEFNPFVDLDGIEIGEINILSLPDYQYLYGISLIRKLYFDHNSQEHVLES